jgi:hypothetical protein
MPRTRAAERLKAEAARFQAQPCQTARQTLEQIQRETERKIAESVKKRQESLAKKRKESLAKRRKTCPFSLLVEAANASSVKPRGRPRRKPASFANTGDAEEPPQEAAAPAEEPHQDTDVEDAEEPHAEAPHQARDLTAFSYVTVKVFDALAKEFDDRTECTDLAMSALRGAQKDCRTTQNEHVRIIARQHEEMQAIKKQLVEQQAAVKKQLAEQLAEQRAVHLAELAAQRAVHRANMEELMTKVDEFRVDLEDQRTELAEQRAELEANKKRKQEKKERKKRAR